VSNLLTLINRKDVLIAQYNSAMISLFELSLHKSCLAAASAENALHQIRLLHSCLEFVKLFFDAYFSLPPALYFTYTIGLFAQLSQAFITLSKLTFFEHDCWDLSHLRQTLDLSEVLQQLAQRFEEAGDGFDLDPLTKEHNSTFSRLARKIRRIKAWFDSRHVEEGGEEEFLAGNAQAMRVVDEGVVGVQLDLLDEAFWLDVMNDGETFQ
jgi:hypothetical protein